MKPFDLVFIVLFLVSIGTLVTAAVKRSSIILRRLAICVAIYMAVVIGVSLASPRRTQPEGEPRCFDDWCITVLRHSRAADGVITVELQVSNRARRADQRENGHVYVIDDSGRRWDPDPAPQAPPLNTLLHPGESVPTIRTFHIPTEVPEVGLVYSQSDGLAFPVCCIIGEDGSLFHKRTIVSLR